MYIFFFFKSKRRHTIFDGDGSPAVSSSNLSMMTSAPPYFLKAAMAAFKKYGGPLIIIDFGTGTTYDVVSKEGDYLGGAIAPGMGISVEALYDRAARLQRVELKPPPTVIGRTTAESMQAGIIFGFTAQVEGMVARIRKELGETARVIATGGFAGLIAAETPVIEVVDQRLMLEGLRLIHELNA